MNWIIFWVKICCYLLNESQYVVYGQRTYLRRHEKLSIYGSLNNENNFKSNEFSGRKSGWTRLENHPVYDVYAVHGYTKSRANAQHYYSATDNIVILRSCIRLRNFNYTIILFALLCSRKYIGTLCCRNNSYVYHFFFFMNQDRMLSSRSDTSLIR